MRRVAITGMGIVSPLGDNLSEVLNSLKNGISGVTFQQHYKDLGLRSQVGAFTKIDISDHVEKKPLRFMGDAAAYAYIAMHQAIADAKLLPEQVSNNRSGLIIGSGGTSAKNVVNTADIIRKRGIRRLSPFMVPRTMSSTVSACLTAPFKIKGVCYSLSSACSTGAHCIGAGMEQILLGKQDIIFAGGSDEEHWTQTCMFDAMGALSGKFNHDPQKASRPYDTDRDGFVVANGAGVVVLEEWNHALKRGAHIYAELAGYGATADGHEIVSPSGDGARRSIELAIETVSDPVDYINTHGTATPIGDIIELKAIKDVFQDDIPFMSSTKSLSGHSLGAAGVHEAIYSLLMLKNNFIAASANIKNIDPAAIDLPIITEKKDIQLKTVMSNSYGFGGTNACLIFQKHIC